MKDEFFETLYNAPIFNSLEKTEKDQLAAVAEIKRYCKNQTVFSFEHKGKYFYLVHEGKLTLRLRSGKIRKYGALGCFGEVAIFDQSYRTGGIKADTPTTLIGFHRSILFDDNKLPTSIALKISRLLANQIVGYIHNQIAVPIEEIIGKGENDQVEFKTSITKFSKEPILRTLTAFYNSAGGTIFIGVEDDKEIVGIGHLSDKDIDNFSNDLTGLIEQRIGACFAKLITYDIEDVNGKRIFRIDCEPANKPALLNIPAKSSKRIRPVFLIRSGARNSTINNNRQMLNYVKERFYEV